MSNTQLSIQISRTSVHVAEVLSSNQEAATVYSADLSESSPLGYKTALKKFFEELPLKEKYDDYTLAWESSRHVLTPLSVFNESNSKAVFKLMFGGEVDEQTVDFNRLMEVGLVNVYEVPDWVKSFFIIQHPQIVIRHESSMVLRALFQNNTFNRKIIAVVNKEYINVMVVERSELKFYNSFEFQNEDDILYHLLYVVEQQSLGTEATDIQFVYTNDAQKNQIINLQGKMKNIQTLRHAVHLPLTSVFKLHSLCV